MTDWDRVMNKKNNALRVVIVFLAVSIAVNFYIYRLYRFEKRYGEMQEESELLTRAIYEAREAVYRGEFRLYEKEDSNTARIPPDQLPNYMDRYAFSIRGDELKKWDGYYTIYNSMIRDIVANPDRAEWQTYLAIKAAKERGEWNEEVSEAIEEKPKPEFRRMTAEEAFGPRVEEKKN